MVVVPFSPSQAPPGPWLLLTAPAFGITTHFFVQQTKNLAVIDQGASKTIGKACLITVATFRIYPLEITGIPQKRSANRGGKTRSNSVLSERVV